MSMSLTLSIQKLEYEDLNKEIKRTMHRSAKDVVQIGFMLRQMAEKKIWAAAYDCFDSYLAEELHLDYSMATRFMSINRKYSVSGNSMEIAEKYEGYSQGLLIEMLNMPQELEEKVSPDMTVKQVREIKRQEKAERESPAPDKVAETETVIDGEYRELKEPEEEKVATSQPEENRAHDETMREPKDDLTIAKDVLKQESKLLDDYLECGDLPEMTVRKQKTIVVALASMVCDLEIAEAEPELEEMTQPELPALKNNDQRKEWLNNYKDWGLWYRDENIDVNYYKYDFIDGSRLIVAEYPQRQCCWKKNKIEDEYFFHLLQTDKEGYRFTYKEKYRNGTDSETYLVEFLKNLQKKK